MNAKFNIFLAGLLILAASAQAAASTGLIQFVGPISRVITPNGDSLNDRAIFCFVNPSDSAIVGKIYTLLGSEVASMANRADAIAPHGCDRGLWSQFVMWDGAGQGVRGGVYIYRIEAEGRVFSGTLLVAR